MRFRRCEEEPDMPQVAEEPLFPRFPQKLNLENTQLVCRQGQVGPSSAFLFPRCGVLERERARPRGGNLQISTELHIYTIE